MPFREWYQEQFEETLKVPLKSDDGFQERELLSLLQGQSIPASLYDYYLVAGRHWMNTNHDRLLPPDKLQTEEAHTIFMEENQCVVQWAYLESESSQPDPMVFLGQIENDRFVWYDEGKTLSEFLIHTWLETCTGE